MLAARRLDHLTFKGNLKGTRYGWLRLTPAYSVHLVADLIDKYSVDVETHILDPFCGTGTTALVCAERGINCETTDINPFLLWLTVAKTRCYTTADIALFREVSREISARTSRGAWTDQASWYPPLHQIEKWWDTATLHTLGCIRGYIQSQAVALPVSVVDLLKLAFCSTMIARAQVSFGHQSMSFKQPDKQNVPLEMHISPVAEAWDHAAALLLASAGSSIKRAPRIVHCDARSLTERLAVGRYDHVITSPPYPNRMSYIRELRPYMYWLGYLSSGREAGELDWEAIGGTWGIATSNLTKWRATDDTFPHEEFPAMLVAISETSPVLARYVQKYFVDMREHIGEIARVVKPGGRIDYIAGNSKFYDVLLPVEQIFASLFKEAGFRSIDVDVIRKRTSKKELFEYVVSGVKPL